MTSRKDIEVSDAKKRGESFSQFGRATVALLRAHTDGEEFPVGDPECHGTVEGRDTRGSATAADVYQA